LDKKTPLYDEHVKAGGRMVPFAGFTMPVQYSGIIEEHRAVREAMGLFDLSHMGEFRVTGKGALWAVDSLVTNDIHNLQVGQIRYTPVCYPDGGIVDDILVYRDSDRLMLVVNAANVNKDLGWIQDHLTRNAQIEDISEAVALIAIQGPAAADFLQTLTSVDLSAVPYYHFTRGTVAEVSAVISRTGYTGEDGFELYVPPEHAALLWGTLLEQGAGQGLRPVGLGARDTLRLEAGYMLYGNDIDQTTTPLEAGLAWTVKFDDRQFIGRERLERQKYDGVRRRMMALEVLDRGIPRAHFAIWREGEHIGELTSGTFSPTLNRGIGLGYVQADLARPGTEVSVEIRQQLHPAKLTRKPLYKREG
jgi:aminomethyltransferase